jgi:hypothetical protein
MADDGASVLRGLRDALKSNSITDVDDFVFQLSQVLDSVGIDAGPQARAKVSLISAAPAVLSSVQLKALKRHLPGVQSALVAAVPTFLPALDDRGRAVLCAFFAPPVSSTGGVVGLSAYLSLSAALAPSPGIPPPARDFVLSTLANVVRSYGIVRMYTAVFSSDSDPQSVKTLAWEDALKAAAALPSKVANAVGRWKEGGWSGDVSVVLIPRAYFDRFAEHLESLTYAASQQPGDAAALPAVRAVFEKLASLGLLAPLAESSRAPSLLPAFLPRALEHIHPPAIAAPYRASFLPELFLPLSSSALSALATALLSQIPYRLSPPELRPDIPEERVRRAADVLLAFLGPPVVGGEAWSAILPALFKYRARGTEAGQGVRRMVVAWAGTGGKSCEL